MAFVAEMQETAWEGLVLELDHILWAAADLADATAAFGRATGTTPAPGGSHAGFGTRNSLASLGEGLYLEVLALDPDQAVDASRAAEIAAITRPRLLTFAVRGEGIEAFSQAAADLGLQPSAPVAMTRKRADGVVLSWRCVYIENLAFQNMVPFIIDWEGSEHPSLTTPRGCGLKSFSAIHPDPDSLRLIYERLSVDVPVLRGPVPGFHAVLGTPRGDVVLT